MEQLSEPMKSRVVFTLEMQKSTEKALELLRSSLALPGEVLKAVEREMPASLHSSTMFRRRGGEGGGENVV